MSDNLNTALADFLDYFCFRLCHQAAQMAAAAGETPIAALILPHNIRCRLAEILTEEQKQALFTFVSLPSAAKFTVSSQILQQKDLLSSALLPVSAKRTEKQQNDVPATRTDFFLNTQSDIWALLAREIVGYSYNQREEAQNIFGHCECLLLREISQKINSRRLSDYDLYVNLEPCLLCAAALINAQIAEVHFLLRNDKAGALVSRSNLFDFSWLNYHPGYKQYEDSCLSTEGQNLLRTFFRRLRQRNRAAGSKQVRKRSYQQHGKTLISPN